MSLALAKEYGDAYLHVEEQVGERTKDLGAALDQLRALEKMKERFFSNVSHDFKTPITVALGSIEEAKRTANSTVPTTLAPAERSLHQLLGMIKDLLDTVKAESGTLKMTWEVAKPADVFRQWVEPYQVLCRRKGIELQVQLDNVSALKIPMDVGKIHRIVDNLLSNAVKFTDRRVDPDRRNSTPGVVRLATHTDEARFYVEISDSGIGIPEDEREKIFDRFFQSSRTSLKDHGGSGIGLSFAKEMVDLHNGKIWVEDSEFGGSKFVVALPLSQDVEVTGEHSVEELLPEDAFHGSLDVTYPPEKPKTSDPSKPSLLVAEDNPEVAQIVASALAGEFNVHFAADGQRAYDRLQTETFDCLVTDVMMPRMRGDELVVKLRAETRTQSLPIVVLSSMGEEQKVTEVLRSGANDYITKPFRQEILQARVRTQIEARRTADWISKNEKVIELGYLAGGMAHQIRNGLNNLENQLTIQMDMVDELFDETNELPPEERAGLRKKLVHSKEILGRAFKRISGLVESIRIYSSGSKKKVEMNAGDSVELALTLHADLIKKRAVQVKTDEALKGLRFLGYSAFHEAVVNLVGNAIGAVAEDGTGTVEITGREVENGIEVSVTDNGMGIAPDVLPRLCAPFFTTKPPGEGTGLGLFMVRDIVEGQHRGTLSIHSGGPGKGATFTVRVPKKAPDSAGPANVRIHGVDVS